MDKLLVLTSIITAFFYGVCVTSFIIGWFKTSKKTVAQVETYPDVSVIIAARNEEKFIGTLLGELLQQDYPAEKMEIIVVDDFSQDCTPDIIKEFINCGNGRRVCYLPNASIKDKGKKGALKNGIEKARGEVVITIDADCRAGTNWVSSMVNAFIKHNARMIIGPVRIMAKNTIFSQLQALEFSSLTASSAGALGLGYPIMCNGANLAFCRKTYHELKEKLQGKKHLSGDDVFLMLAIHMKYPGSIGFAKDHHAIVDTYAAGNLESFLNQRMRWTSKSTGYKEAAPLVVGAIVASINLLLIVLLAFTLPGNGLIGKSLLCLWVFKFIVDFPLLYLESRFMNNSQLLRYYPLLQLIYPFYVSITLLLAFLVPFTWKDRSQKKGKRYFSCIH